MQPEEIGGTLIEEIEVDDIEGVIECVYGELIEEGYSEDEVESAIEDDSTEATSPWVMILKVLKSFLIGERTRDKLKKKAKGFLGKVAVKAYNKAREAKVAATPAVQRAKISAKRGIKRWHRRLLKSYESRDCYNEAVYEGWQKKPDPTDKRLTGDVLNDGDPAYQAYKAGDKRYKAMTT